MHFFSKLLSPNKLLSPKVLRYFSAGQQTSPKSETQRLQLIQQIDHYAPLIAFQDHRQLLEVSLPNHLDTFQTMILGVDLYAQQLIIDELTPHLKNPEDLVGYDIILKHYHQRQVLAIDTQVQTYNPQTHSLVVTLPENIGYGPRRNSRRLEILGDMSAKAVIYPVYGSPWYATIKNISTGGLRIAVAGDIRTHLRKHLFLKRCELQLNDTQLRCTGRVKAYSYQSRPFRHTLVSIAFESLSHKDLDNLLDIIEQTRLAA